jgi:hypothetical protein
MPNTTRLQIPYPSGSTANDVPTHMQQLANALDSLAVDLQGLASARPAASTRGRYYWATDTKTLSRDDGSAWQQVISLSGTNTLNGQLALRSDQNAILYKSADGTDRFLVGLRDDLGAVTEFFFHSYGGNFNWRFGSTVTMKFDVTQQALAVGQNAAGGTGTAVQIGSFGASEAYIKATGTATNVPLVLRCKGQVPNNTAAIHFEDGGGLTSAYFTSPNGLVSQETPLVIGRQLGAVYDLQRVTMGATDSGGSGFRCLRVPN